MIPWGLLETNPVLVVLFPFGWLLWQLYVPRIVDTAFNHRDEDGHLYHTWWTTTRGQLLSQFDRVDERMDTIGNDVERVAETQEDLVNITLAQTHHMNGYDEDIDVAEVEETLLEKRDKRPDDFLKTGRRYEDTENKTDSDDAHSDSTRDT